MFLRYITQASSELGYESKVSNSNGSCNNCNSNKNRIVTYIFSENRNLDNAGSACVVIKELIVGSRLQKSLCNSKKIHQAPLEEAKWSVYIHTAPHDIRMQHFIQEVIFCLYSCRDEEKREYCIDTPPFMVQNLVVADFPVEIKLHFRDPWQSCAMITYTPQMYLITSNNVIHQPYDNEIVVRIVLKNPSALLESMLKDGSKEPLHSNSSELSSETDSTELEVRSPEPSIARISSPLKMSQYFHNENSILAIVRSIPCWLHQRIGMMCCFLPDDN